MRMKCCGWLAGCLRVLCLRRVSQWRVFGWAPAARAAAGGSRSVDAGPAHARREDGAAQDEAPRSRPAALEEGPHRGRRCAGRRAWAPARRLSVTTVPFKLRAAASPRRGGCSDSKATAAQEGGEQGSTGARRGRFARYLGRRRRRRRRRRGGKPHGTAHSSRPLRLVKAQHAQAAANATERDARRRGTPSRAGMR